jgi:hypothetical protein
MTDAEPDDVQVLHRPVTRRGALALLGGLGLSQVSLALDMVFSDGVSLQTPAMTGNATSGYVSSLVVGVTGAV